MKRIVFALAGAGLLALTPAAASAQETGAGTVDTAYGTPQPEEDDRFPWGLLGLLGLAGLLGRKRKSDIHVDNRTNR